MAVRINRGDKGSGPLQRLQGVVPPIARNNPLLTLRTDHLLEMNFIWTKNFVLLYILPPIRPEGP